ncbi:SDR family NAD(P)-dependent oxidoreductase [Actinomadura litoris]|uniref:SDR family NAD(P)-dependent oxidoreductase n=1 Tax=Actinomadura litoris TaxID=2678616 RepID=UPI001FA734B5|nr:SDR family NAD(P)-dependent oxidoreductase [Actinomadura litoris]
MSRTLVIVGAGPGLGMGVARAFGRAGFQVGLIARTKEKLDDLVADLAAEDVQATAFPADIRDRSALVAALTTARRTLGPVDVLEYSPSPTGPITHAVDTTAETVTAQLDLHVSGAITAVREVLPDMRARGTGTLLLTTGVSSTVPAPFLANVGMAMAALRNWAHTLHAELKPHGIYAGTVTIATGITPDDTEHIGARYYRMHQQRDRPEEVIGDLDAFRALVAQYKSPVSLPLAAAPQTRPS